MPKSGDLKALDEDLKKVLQEMPETPAIITVHDTVDIDGISLLQLDAVTPLAEEMGIPFVFELTKFDVMKARALAYGVTLERRYS